MEAAKSHGGDLNSERLDGAHTPELSPPAVVSTPLEAYSEIELAGFRVLVDPEALATGKEWRRVRAALLVDLERAVEVVPGAALAELRGVRIVVTRSTRPRPDWDGASAACLHPSAGWLVEHGYDAERQGAVEILNMDKYLLWRAEQPVMILHELAHAYHLGLGGGGDGAGYEDARVIRAYESAMAAGLYEAVGFVLNEEGQTRRAYAAGNAQEYFAELTEAYFGRNDYFPFTREDLREHDRSGYAMIEDVWGVGRGEDAEESADLRHGAVARP